MKPASFLLSILCITLISCGKGKISFHLSSLNGVDEIDTIGRNSERNIFILGFVRNRAFGHFTYDLGIVKGEGNTSDQPLCYEMENAKKRFRVTRYYIVLLGESDTDIIGKWRKGHILDTIDSVAQLKQKPKELNFISE